MKIISFLLLLTALSPLKAFSQYYESEPYEEYPEEMYIDEGDPNSEIYPPVSDDYYLSEDMEMQEDAPYPEDQEWSLGEEELPAEDYAY
ncbi:MAG: hypothetical protein ACLGHN_02300 [Bacteriovoracia bacterium]